MTAGSSTIGRHEFAIGTGIALIMAALFAWISPGRALLVTFVPGIAASWAMFAFLHARRHPLPDFAAVSGSYFPGLVTAQTYWVLGPVALRRLGLGRPVVTIFIALWGAVLLVLAGGFVDLGALRAG